MRKSQAMIRGRNAALEDRRKKLIKKRIYLQDVEYIEYYLRNEIDAGDDYCVIGNPAFIKLKDEKMAEDFILDYEEDLNQLKRYSEGVPTIKENGVPCTQEYVCSRLNEFYEDTKKYRKIVSVMQDLYQNTKLTDSTKTMFEMFSKTFGFDLNE